MNQAESHWVVRLFFTFQNKHYLFLVMEYLPGGDVGALVKKLGTLDEDWTRGYIAEVVLGLQSLHDKGIVHRFVRSLWLGLLLWSNLTDPPSLPCLLPQ